MKLIVGLLGFGLLVGAAFQLKVALQSSFNPDAGLIGFGDSEESSVASGNISKIVVWSLLFSTSMFVLAQVMTA